MATVTGTGVSGDNNGLTEEQRQIVEKAKKPVEVANRFRLLFLFVGLIVLLFIFFGNKIWEGTGWYDNTVQHLYQFLLWDVFFMLLFTFIKFGYVVRYNRIVKNL